MHHGSRERRQRAWARALIHLTRDPQCPAPTFFPTLEQPAAAPSDDSDEHFPVERRLLAFDNDVEDEIPAAALNLSDVE